MGEEDPPPISRKMEGTSESVYDIWNSLNGFAAWAKVKKEVGESYNADYHLFRSCEIGNVGMCRFLLDCKLVTANTPWRYSGGYILGSLPVDVAMQYNQQAVVELLEERGAQESTEGEGEGETGEMGKRGKRRRGRNRGPGAEGDNVLSASLSNPDLKTRVNTKGESGPVVRGRRKRVNTSGSVIPMSELRESQEGLTQSVGSDPEDKNVKKLHFVKPETDNSLPSFSSSPGTIGSSSFSARREAVSVSLNFNNSLSSSFSLSSSPSSPSATPPHDHDHSRQEEVVSPPPNSPGSILRSSPPGRSYFKSRRSSKRNPPLSPTLPTSPKRGETPTPLSPSLTPTPASPYKSSSNSPPSPSVPPLSPRAMYMKSASSTDLSDNSLPSSFARASCHIPSHLRPPGEAGSPSLGAASQLSSTRIYSPKYADRFLLVMAGKFYRSIFKFFEAQIENTQDNAQQNMLELAFQRVEEELINSFPPSVVRLLPVSHGALYGVGSTRLARVAGRGRLASIFLKVSDLTARKSMAVEEFDVDINHHSAFDMMVDVLTQPSPEPQAQTTPQRSHESPRAPTTPPPSRPPRTSSPLAPRRSSPKIKHRDSDVERVVVKKDLLPPPPPPRGKEEKKLRTNLFVTFGEMLSMHSESDILFFLKSIDLAVFGKLRDPLTLATPLHRLCEHGNLPFIRGMLEQGCPVDVKDEKGLLPLHFLVKKLAKEEMVLDKDATDVEYVVKRLVEGVDPMYVDNEGNGDTLLHLFIKQGSLFLVKLLLDSTTASSGPPSPSGSLPRSSTLTGLELQNSEGLTVWDCAVELENEEVGTEIVQELMKRVSVSTLAAHGPSILKSVSKHKRMYSFVIDRMVSVLPCVYGLSDDPLKDPKDPELLQSITKEELVKILLSPKTKPDFLKKMLSCRQYWIPPSELVSFCVRYAHSPGWDSNSIYRLLFLWAEVCPSDFYSIEMRMLMPGLIERGGIGGEESHFRNLWEEKWRELKMGQGEVLKELEGKCFAASQKFGKIKVPDLMDISVTMVAVDVFAEHWFFWLYNLQKMIPMGELLTYPLSSAVSGSSSAAPPSSCDASLSPLTIFNTLLNDITNWVVVLILSLRDVEDRVKMITYFVELLDRSWKSRNFCLSLALSTGLQNHAVSRLKNTWKRVDEEVVEKLETLRNQFSPSRNFQRFREALVSTSGPAAVYFGVAFRDLIYLHDSAPTFVGPNQASINVQKLTGIYKVGEKWHHNLIKFDIPAMSTPANYSIFSLVPGCYELFSPDSLDKISRILEPPQNKQTSDKETSKKHKTKPRGGSKTSRISLSGQQQAWISSLTFSFPSLGGKCFVDEVSSSDTFSIRDPETESGETGSSISFGEPTHSEKFEVSFGVDEKMEDGEKAKKRGTMDLGKLKRNVSSKLPKKLAKREDSIDHK